MGDLQGEPGFELYLCAREKPEDHWDLSCSVTWNGISNAVENDLLTRGYQALGWLLEQAKAP